MGAWVASWTGGGTSGTSDRSVSGVTPSATGNLLVVMVTLRGNVNESMTCSDDQGGSYDLIETAKFNTNESIIGVFIRTTKTTTTSAHTVTVASGANDAGEIGVFEISGMGLTGASCVRTLGKQVNQSGGTPTITLLGGAGSGTPATLYGSDLAHWWAEDFTDGDLTPETITIETAGAVATGTDTCVMDFPASIAAGDMLICAVAFKSVDGGNNSVDDAGFINFGTYSGHLGADGPDSGWAAISIRVKIADGTETGQLTWTSAAGGAVVTASVGRVFRFSKSGANSLWVFDGQSAARDATGSSYSTTMPALTYPGGTAGDLILAFTGLNTDNNTWSAQAISATGISAWGTVTELNDSGTSNGDDCALVVSAHPITTGTATAAMTYSMTGSGSSGNENAGATFLLTLRAITQPALWVDEAGGVPQYSGLGPPGAIATSGTTPGGYLDVRMAADSNIATSTASYFDGQMSIPSGTTSAQYFGIFYVPADPPTSDFKYLFGTGVFDFVSFTGEYHLWLYFSFDDIDLTSYINGLGAGYHSFVFDVRGGADSETNPLRVYIDGDLVYSHTGPLTGDPETAYALFAPGEANTNYAYFGYTQDEEVRGASMGIAYKSSDFTVDTVAEALSDILTGYIDGAAPTAALTTNMVISFLGADTQTPGTTVPSGWTGRIDAGQTTPDCGLRVATRDSGFTLDTVTWGGTQSGVWAAIALELDGTLHGTTDAALGDATSSGTGTVDVAGVLSKSLDDTTSSGTGTVDVVGTASPTLGNTTTTADGDVIVKGALSKTFDDVTAAGEAEHGVPIEGTLSKTLDGATASATVIKTLFYAFPVQQPLASSTNPDLGENDLGID